MHSTDYLGRLFGLEGKHAFITGASRGLGLAFAEALASAGARVTIGGRKAGDLKVAADRLRAAGHSIAEAVIDVTDTQSVDKAVAAAETGTGPIDILVNNAGIQRRAPLESFSDADWDALMATNLDGVFKVSRAVVKGMIARQRGAIINVSSVQSVLARPSIAPYAASKGAITMLTKSMAGEWGQHGVRVNAIAPGYFRTELNAALVADEKFSGWLTGRTPMRRWGEVQELAGAAVFLASDAASFVSGQTLLVDGGITSVL
ncbi:glucose 1-dehydrogenase [Mesorhizobium sp. M8A.F.Ca.ET.208.01.1.1]|uniref:glucose 1-dehydrogenase n=1 Tax=unclassified Mesorhizobium TaxID=325217 RepID=UPI000FEA6906|nr:MULTISPECIES: glucose 1-dehydrogenase [unclassified Mesorhizobium]RWC77488.1 MAG: glucose 1-dehydrogenase [Mesorhizobium sp.]TGQ83345.1 glucose 1-dehydrogenase [Mesorhizobium sp. M8A.F.Ca.ET.207.01.1.1]TGQ95753.1 glucose 1-dehydrogenase [Mesorhizobium sp. M8A.F.Ca.ET.208.01.1.1]TGT56243.1 glucose 1-dehydrogenase [Mesorhizobium sp. M8A.F.Ca.ET.167.01.1.1]